MGGQCCPAEYKCNPVTTLPPATVTEQELSTVTATTEENKIHDNDGTIAPDFDDETTQSSQETATIESEEDESKVGEEQATEIPEELESTSVGEIISEALGSVGSTISSIFGTSSDTQDISEDKVDSAETEKSPVEGEFPGISVQDIEDSLEEDTFEETTDRIDENISEQEATKDDTNNPDFESEQSTTISEDDSDKVN